MQRFPIVLFLLTVLTSHATASDRYEGPIIDMHLHAHDTIWAKTRQCYPAPCEGQPTASKMPEDVLEGTLAAMDRNSIVLGYLADTPDLVAKWVTRAPDRFFPARKIARPEKMDIAAFRASLEDGTFQGIGEVTTQYWGYSPADPALMPFFDLAADLDVPVLIHTLGIGARTPEFRVAMGDPRLLEPVVVKHKKLRIYVENCGYPFAEEMTAMMYQYSNIYCDVSTIFHLTPKKRAHQFLKALIDAELGKRIMYGSDQMIWPEVIDEVIETLQAADYMSQDQKADLFYNNAARFLQLSDEVIAAHHQARKP